MKINSIHGNYYGINSNKLNNTSSKPAFKGKNFAEVLKKEYSCLSVEHKNKFECFQELMQKASQEDGFRVINNDVFKNLHSISSLEGLILLLDSWYKDKNQTIPIAEDSEGSIIEYNVYNPKNSAAIKSLVFSSNDTDGKKQSVSFETTKFTDDMAQIFVTSDDFNIFYKLSDNQYQDALR